MFCLRCNVLWRGKRSVKNKHILMYRQVADIKAYKNTFYSPHLPMPGLCVNKYRHKICTIIREALTGGKRNIFLDSYFIRRSHEKIFWTL